MAISSPVNTFDAVPARRPSLQDCGGNGKVDGPVLPDGVTMICGDDANQWAMQTSGQGAVCPLAIIVVTQSAGAYTIAAVRAPGVSVVVGTFTLTKNSTGNVTLSWTAGALPGTVAAHGGLQGAPYMHYTTVGSTSATIVIQDHTGTAQDCSFTLWIY